MAADTAGDAIKLSESVVECEGEPASVGKRGAVLGNIVAVFFCKPN